MIIRHESLASYLAIASTLPLRLSPSFSSKNWDLGVSGKQALGLATSGDPSMVASTIDAIDALTPTLDEHLAPTWRAGVAGSRVSVPAYLSGSPLAMRRRVPSAKQIRHVSIYVEITTLAIVGAEDMLARGRAILALLEHLQATKINVDLYLVADTESDKDGDLFQVIPIESRPLDLSVAGFALAHPAFSRNIVLVVAKTHGPTAPSKSLKRLGRDAYVPFIRETLDLEPTDVYIPELFSNDLSSTNPSQWIADRVSQITQ